MNPESWLNLKRIVRFGDTDAAGVIHFYQLLKWCHESWEESLELYGLSPKEIFPNLVQETDVVTTYLPIVHCDARFLSPIVVGDHLDIILLPRRLDAGSFKVETIFKIANKDVAVGIIRHKSINSHSRKRCPLPDNIDRWLEASSLNSGVTSV
ncbi:acyl-CoA thioesterase [Prochlorococcus sp. MIT 1223]|uniref:acyl-CoA thioesterase n=1 Tax=Prochlorococcus sp. MIT 1223 TaxID=3096217 RepID=UPI002A74927D|nr:acyl-CoA thioesterase [Prochlorococcus sp. MIT 1223]